MTKAILLVTVLASAGGCLRETTYKCTTSDQCTGTGGACEANGFCSFTDAECAEGRRYAEHSGSLSRTCVGDVQPGVDSGVDPVDSTTSDVPVGNCPTTYAAVSGQTHRYRVIANTAAFETQLAACDADGATTYLAVPDDQGELDAILTAATSAPVWIGANDIDEDGTFVTANGGTLAMNSPLWDTAAGEPDNATESGGGAANCVSGNAGELSDDRCMNSYVAVCECEP